MKSIKQEIREQTKVVNAGREEWKAWLALCNEFKESTGFEINIGQFNKLVELIKEWGELEHQRIASIGESSK